MHHITKIAITTTAVGTTMQHRYALELERCQLLLWKPTAMTTAIITAVKATAVYTIIHVLKPPSNITKEYRN